MSWIEDNLDWKILEDYMNPKEEIIEDVTKKEILDVLYEISTLVSDDIEFSKELNEKFKRVEKYLESE
jgi:hypothetical protein